MGIILNFLSTLIFKFYWELGSFIELYGLWILWMIFIAWLISMSFIMYKL
jgi:hypothetical protein